MERFSAQLKAKKCNQLILLPSFSPNSLSFVIKAQTHQFLLLGAGTSALFTAFKSSFSVQKPDPSLTKSPIHPWPSWEIHSTPLIHKQKCGEKGEWWCLLKLSRRLLAEPQIASPSSRCNRLTWLKLHIDFQPPWWSLCAAALLFSSFVLNECRLCPTS